MSRNAPLPRLKQEREPLIRRPKLGTSALVEDIPEERVDTNGQSQPTFWGSDGVENSFLNFRNGGSQPSSIEDVQGSYRGPFQKF